jgi:hypothetical protein
MELQIKERKNPSIYSKQNGQEGYNTTSEIQATEEGTSPPWKTPQAHKLSPHE